MPKSKVKYTWLNMHANLVVWFLKVTSYIYYYQLVLKHLPFLFHFSGDLTTLYMIELFLSDQWHGQMSSQEESLAENDARWQDVGKRNVDHKFAVGIEL